MTEELSCLFVKKPKLSKRKAKRIAKMQASFERFWGYLDKVCPDNDEHQQGLYRLQESCVWLCRSIVNGPYKYEIKEKAEDETPEIIAMKLAAEKEDQEAIIKANLIEPPSCIPNVIVKKRRFQINK